MGVVHWPAAVPSGTLRKHATPSTARSSAAALSISFFFFIWFEVAGGATMPSHTTRSPGCESAGGSTNLTSLLSSLEAHSTMPLDLKPASLASFRLHTTSTERPSSRSAVG
eukprot:scaffold16997_cov57-Phaeocystis_antarctica.AAC.4